MEFSVVVPARNEAGNLAPLLEEIEQAMAGQGAWEVIVVDDGSDDGTGAELHDARARYPGLRVVRHSRSYGQSCALLSGVEAARAPWIITLDGDGQNDPADIPGLIRRLSDTPVPPTGLMLAGHRVHRRDSLLKRVSSRAANAVRRRLLRDDTPDTGCGLKLFPRAAFLRLPAFDHMHRFLPALMLREGVPVISVAVRHRPRRRGVSKYGVHNRLWAGLVDLAGVLWLLRRRPGSTGSEGWGRQLGDNFGVAWLQRRPCRRPAGEGALDG